ncbi:uncharacterized protein IL334_005880 [Kwoniella shivajii]|uniref:GH16 domain-containing protein n=1 Tax=Kwoniella shivajii TaxID=564305 RepID=A0ABZ1D4P7_9TREE|nr:hypothetical protein IL334_005880 [Kwoniella shivajii]
MIIPLNTLLFALPLLVHALPNHVHGKRCQVKDAASSSTLAGQALVATGGRGGHHWGASETTSVVDEAEPTEVSDYSPEEEEEEGAGEEEEEEDRAIVPTTIRSAVGSIVPSSVAATKTKTSGGAASSVSIPGTAQSSVGESSSTKSATASASQPTSTAGTGNTTTTLPSGDCSCGYVLSSYDNAYFPKAIIASFDTITSVSALAGLGLEINDGWKAGSVADDGTYCQGVASNVAINNGILTLTVPGGQSTGGVVSGAEIQTTEAITGGVFTMNAQLSPVSGTCQAIFTYTVDDTASGDEQDIEMVFSQPGLQLTNWDPTGSGLNDFSIDQFPNEPSTSFNDYTIAWLKDATSYYYNGVALDSPKKYQSVNPSNVIINNWSSGDPTFSMGPPAEDTVMQVKSLTFYYQTEPMSSYPAYPSGCTEADACKV